MWWCVCVCVCVYVCGCYNSVIVDVNSSGGPVH